MDNKTLNKRNRIFSIIAGILFIAYLILRLITNIKSIVEGNEWSPLLIIDYISYTLFPIAMFTNKKYLSAIAVGINLIMYIYMIIFVYGLSEYLKYFIFLNKLELIFTVLFFIDIILIIVKKSNFSKTINLVCVLFFIVDLFMNIQQGIKFHYYSDIILSAIYNLAILMCAISYYEKIELPKRSTRHSTSNDNINTNEKFSSYETAEKIKGYHELLDKGIITQEEYEKKKDELL